MPLMSVKEIVLIIRLWQEEYKKIGSLKTINHIQIFENKGKIMGCSNLHPHGQVWAQESIPTETLKKQSSKRILYEKQLRCTLID